MSFANRNTAHPLGQPTYIVAWVMIAAISFFVTPWFAAFDKVECVEKDGLKQSLGDGGKVWFVKNAQAKIPDYIESDFEAEKVDDFRCDFNYFELYSLKEK